MPREFKWFLRLLDHNFRPGDLKTAQVLVSESSSAYALSVWQLKVGNSLTLWEIIYCLKMCLLCLHISEKKRKMVRLTEQMWSDLLLARSVTKKFFIIFPSLKIIKRQTQRNHFRGPRSQVIDVEIRTNKIFLVTEKSMNLCILHHID